MMTSRLHDRSPQDNDNVEPIMRVPAHNSARLEENNNDTCQQLPVQPPTDRTSCTLGVKREDTLLRRQQVVESLKQKLLQSHIMAGNNEKAAARMAQSLEAILHAQQSNKRSNSDDDDASYNNNNNNNKASQPPQQDDDDDMNQRLQTLVQTLQRRRQRRRAAQQQNTVQTRRQQVLVHILGPAQHAKIKRLVQQIKLARLEKAAENCAQCRRLEDGTLVCPSTPTMANNHTGKFPAAVHGLFFKVNLLHALEFTSLQTWRNTNWEELVHEAEDILRNYQRWRAFR